MENLVLTKGQTLDLKKADGTSIPKIRVGLSWDVSDANGNVDLDLFVVKKEDKTTAFFGAKTAIKGITLGDDNLTGEWDGDDETVEMDATQSEDGTYAVCINIFEAKSRNQTLNLVNNAKATVYDSTNNKVLATYELSEKGGDNTGIIVWEIKDTGDNYSFTAVWTFVNGDINEIRNSL